MDTSSLWLKRKHSYLERLVNEVRYLSGEFTKVRVTTAVSLTCDGVINAKTQQVRPEFLRLLSQTNNQQTAHYKCLLCLRWRPRHCIVNDTDVCNRFSSLETSSCQARSPKT